MAYGTAAAQIVQTTTPGLFVSLCGKSAPIVSTFLCCAPFPTIQKITKEKSIGNLPLLPYSSLVVNAFLWLMYGLLKNEYKVWAPNAFGFVMGLYYCRQFRLYTPKNAKNLPGTMSQHIQGVIFMLTSALLVVGSMSRKLSANVIGKLGVLVCIILFGSPLSTLKTVIMTKNASSIPAPFTLTCLLNCFLWSVFGLFEVGDFNIYFPNLLGLGSAIAQLFLLVLYGQSDGQNKELPL